MMRPVLAMTAMFTLFCGGMQALPPNTLNYQGRIRLNSTQLPIPDSTGNTVTFNLYTVATGGAPFWTETWNTATSCVSTISGIFNVVLGTYTSLSTEPFNVPYYLEVVWTDLSGTAETMSPRQPLTSAPYAFVAKNVTGPLDLTGTGSANTPIFSSNPNGIGILGQGQTGTAGTADGSGGIGVLAQDGGQTGALGLEVQGNSLFVSGTTATFAPGSAVNFAGATVSGLSAGVSAPVSLTLNSAVAAPLSISNASGIGVLVQGGPLGISVTSNTAVGQALYARSNSTVGTLKAVNDNASSTGYGLDVQTAAGAGVNVLSSNGYGVNVQVNGSGAGVNVQATGGGYGIGINSSDSTGLNAFSNSSYAVFGQTGTISLPSIYGVNSSANSSGGGVQGESTNGYGVMGKSDGVGPGVLAQGTSGPGLSATSGTGVAVFASGPVAMSSTGNVQFNGAANSVTFNTAVFFNGPVTGMVATVPVPLTLTANVPFPGGLISVTNTGNGFGLVGYATVPGQGTNGPPDLTTAVTGGVKGFTSVSDSAGVLGYTSLTYSAGVGTLGVGYTGVGGFGTNQPGSAGGMFESNALNGTGISANAISGTAGSFNGLTGVVGSANSGGIGIMANQGSGLEALQVNGNAVLGGNGGNTYFQNPGSVGFGGNVTFTPGTTVNFTGANVQGLTGGGITLPATLSGNYATTLMTMQNDGSADTLDVVNGGGGYAALSVTAVGSTYAIYAQNAQYGSAILATLLPSSSGLPVSAIEGYDQSSVAGNTAVNGFSINGYGVDGVSDSSTGYGVYAENEVGGVSLYVQESSASGGDSADAIEAYSSQYNPGNPDAIYGDDQSNGGQGSGVFGTSSWGIGVYGQSSTTMGIGVQAENTAAGGLALSVVGDSQFSNGSLVDLSDTQLDFTGAAISGLAPLDLTNTTSAATIYADNSGGGGTGISGRGSSVGVMGTTAAGAPSVVNPSGVVGDAAAVGGVGVYGENFTGGNGYGVVGTNVFAVGLPGTQVGVVGIANNGDGVYGSVASPTSGSAGVFGENSTGYGMEAVNSANQGVALYVSGTVASSYQSVTVTGTTPSTATLNASAGRVYLTQLTTISAGLMFTVADNYVTDNSIVLVTLHMVNVSLQTLPPVIATVSPGGGSFILNFDGTTGENVQASNLTGFSFVVMNLQ